MLSEYNKHINSLNVFLFQRLLKCEFGWKKLLVGFLSLVLFTRASSQQGQLDTTVTNQKDVIDIILKVFKINPTKSDSTRQNKKVQFSLVPSGGVSPGGGAAIVTALNAAFYTGPVSTTSLSTVTFSPWFSFD